MKRKPSNISSLPNTSLISSNNFNNPITFNDSKSSSSEEGIFNINKVPSKHLNQKNQTRQKRKRKFNKDCILKKVKSRFIKYFINDHMIKFTTFINNQQNHKFKSKLVFKRLDDYFIKDVTLKRNSEWNFINKSAFDLFNEYSKMSIEEVYKFRWNNPSTFNLITKDLDNLTQFVIFQPFGEVFNSLMNDDKFCSYFIEKVISDLDKKNHDKNAKDHYYDIFKENIKNFVKYFCKNLD